MINKKKELEIGGLSFGITSGIITTLGLLVGVNSATNGSKLALIAAIVTIAFADAFSDAFGMHLAEESRLDEKNKPIWLASVFTFLGKVVFSSVFIIPVLMFTSSVAVAVSVAVGVSIIAFQAAYIASRKNSSVTRNMVEHSVMAMLVIVASVYLGNFANYLSKINW